MAAPMPMIAVLIACKTVSVPYASELDEHNAAFTHHQPTQWVVEGGKLQCRRHEVQLTPMNPAQDQEMTRNQCFRALPLLSVQWDQSHSFGSYRVFRASCPTPVMDTRTGEIIAWQMPDCGMRDKIECDVDIAI